MFSVANWEIISFKVIVDFCGKVSSWCLLQDRCPNSTHFDNLEGYDSLPNQLHVPCIVIKSALMGIPACMSGWQYARSQTVCGGEDPDSTNWYAVICVNVHGLGGWYAVSRWRPRWCLSKRKPIHSCVFPCMLLRKMFSSVSCALKRILQSFI